VRRPAAVPDIIAKQAKGKNMFWFGRSRELDDFAIGLAREFTRLAPPGAEAPGAQRVARAIDDICGRAKTFQREKRLGIYGRAKIGTSFKFELKNSGYPSEFVDHLTRQLLLIMSGK
jgi:hypothetical protein